jgi:hypothetical protein
MLRASLGASALVAVVTIGWGCGLSVNDSTFPSSSSSGGSTANGGSAAHGGGGAANVGGAGQGGATSGGGQSQNGGGPGSGGAGQGGSGNAGPGGGGAGGGSNCPGLGDACSDCAATQCTATYCGCYGNASCDQLSLCFSQCAMGDMNCYQSCETMYPDGISSFFLLDNCTAGACQAECPGSVALTACEVCLFTSCDTEMNTCLANPECAALIACVAQCAPQNMSCPTVCVAQHPGGTTDASAVRQCTSANCSSSCP